MRLVIPINRDWFYKSNYNEKDILGKISGKYQKVTLPHTNVELPYNYFDDKICCFVSCYKRMLQIEQEWKGRRLFLDFEGVMSYAQIFVNGELAGEHKGGYTAFSVEITKFVNFNDENEITVVVDSTERSDTPPFGGQIDYLTYGGIYREVCLRLTDREYIKDAFVQTKNIFEGKKIVVVDVALDGIDDANDYEICVTLLDNEKEIGICKKKLNYMNEVQICLDNLENIYLWSIDSPQLYRVKCILYKNGCAIDCWETKIGFRECEFKEKVFFLNGEKIKIVGLNRHQSYPYVGYAMPASVQRRDADILKEELGLNLVRTSHYPQSHHFLDRCDEIGLLVFEEIPGWQYIGDEKWQKQVLADVEQMIVRDRNHPSIILWGVRINESQDHHDLYTKTNQLARRLDPTRATGGVRCLPNSELIEDVYTMNDFIHDNGYGEYLASVIKNYKTYDHLQNQDGKVTALRVPKMVTGLDYNVPYLVTEYGGHTYPTKRFDQEERAVEFALRHTRIQNASWINPEIAGAIGWCAFDYNTHADFGSGDKICYHGVMDMYRIPKFAAYAYSSQINPKKRIVMEPATYWSRGERNIGGVIPLEIFTNCDAIKMLYGSNEVGTFKPAYETYPGLKHPPVVIDEMLDTWGEHWEDATFIGYFEGKEVIRRSYSRNPEPAQLQIIPDENKLVNGDAWDAMRVVVKAVDKQGNIMPYFQEPIMIQTEGAGNLIGPSLLTLVGGQIAFWVRSNGEIGILRITVSCQRFPGEKIVEIDVE